MTCTCQPGTPENGFHEVRGADCEREYREAWMRFLKDVPRMLKELREEFEARPRKAKIEGRP